MCFAGRIDDRLEYTQIVALLLTGHQGQEIFVYRSWFGQEKSTTRGRALRIWAIVRLAATQPC